MKLLEILEESKKDLPNLKKDELDSENARIPGLFHKWHREYVTIHIEMLESEKKLKKLLIEKFEYYSGKADPQVYKEKPFGPKLITKEKIEQYVEADIEVEGLRFNYNVMIEKDAAVKRILEQINNRNWLCKNMLGAMEFYNNNQV